MAIRSRSSRRRKSVKVEEDEAGVVNKEGTFGAEVSGQRAKQYLEGQCVIH